MLIKFLGKIYKNEPTSLLIFRRFVIVISIGLLIAILIGLCIEFHNELPSVNTRFTSSDYFPLPKYDIFPKALINGDLLSPFEVSLMWKNQYFLSQPTSDRIAYYWRFTRTIKYTLNSDILSYFGKPTYIKQPYIESNMQVVPLPFADANSNESFITNSSAQANQVLYAMLQFGAEPNAYLKEEIEQNKTILSLLGVLGGIWSAITGFYIFLFGLGLFSPWGFVQKLKPFRNEYGKRLSPFVEDSQSDGFNTKEQSDTKEHEISSILKRLENLEKSDRFYKEYIIDVSLSFVKTDTSLANNSSSSP
ncbi:16823_t:CDS:2 [Gigaspora rosea]|nr:16823_t:CDS:2 [Gigaspora rosea]